jgi:flavin reductase (DIM6/NTAB) family NADH-FMN oxidoreductase RutF
MFVIPEGARMTFDERQFRDALSRFATGVAVVTSQVDGIRMAITVSSFNAVSLHPPLVLFSIARSAQSFDLWQRAETFAVMLLEEGQGALSTRFARSGANKWHDIDAVPGATGVPLLPTWLACFECTVYARYEGGDHEIVVGQVVNLQNASGHYAGPLVFYGGRYRALSTEGGYGTGPGDIWLHGW